MVEQFPWGKLGHGVASSILVDPRTKGLWLGFFDGGVVNFEGGEVRKSFGKKDGLGGGRVMGLQLGGDGVLWAATEGGLSRIKDGRVLTVTAANGLPCDGVHWAVEDNSHFFWLFGWHASSWTHGSRTRIARLKRRCSTPRMESG